MRANTANTNSNATHPIARFGRGQPPATFGRPRDMPPLAPNASCIPEPSTDGHWHEAVGLSYLPTSTGSRRLCSCLVCGDMVQACPCCIAKSTTRCTEALRREVSHTARPLSAVCWPCTLLPHSISQKLTAKEVHLHPDSVLERAPPRCEEGKSAKRTIPVRNLYPTTPCLILIRHFLQASSQLAAPASGSPPSTNIHARLVIDRSQPRGIGGGGVGSQQAAGQLPSDFARSFYHISCRPCQNPHQVINWLEWALVLAPHDSKGESEACYACTDGALGPIRIRLLASQTY